MAGCPWVPREAVCACVHVPPLAQGLFVFLLIGLFFHVQPTKPHVFPLISPARLGWSPQHARGLPAGPERRGRLPTPLARPGQARSGRVGQGDPSSFSPAQAPPTFLLLPGIQGPWPVPILSCGIPQCTPTSGLPNAPPSSSHRLLFPSQPNRAEHKVVLNQGFWSSHPDQSNINFKNLDKELSNLNLVD